jgi:hypothetical protein
VLGVVDHVELAADVMTAPGAAPGIRRKLAPLPARSLATGARR